MYISRDFQAVDFLKHQHMLRFFMDVLKAKGRRVKSFVSDFLCAEAGNQLISFLLHLLNSKITEYLKMCATTTFINLQTLNVLHFAPGFFDP